MDITAAILVGFFLLSGVLFALWHLFKLTNALGFGFLPSFPPRPGRDFHPILELDDIQHVAGNDDHPQSVIDGFAVGP